MKTVSKQTFRRSLLASACVIAMAGAAHAEPHGQPGADYNLWVGMGAEASAGLRDYVMAVTVPQQNFASVTAEAQSVYKIIQLADGEGSTATMRGNSIGAAASANRSTTGIDLGLLQAGTEGPSGIGSIVSQLQGSGSQMTLTGANGMAGGVAATVVDARIGISAAGSAPQASVSANSVAADVLLNQSATTLAGDLPAVQGSWQPGSSRVTQGAWASEASSTGLLNAGTFQAALNGRGQGGSATVSQAALALSIGGGSQQALDVDGNAITARHGANDASTVIDARSAAAGLRGGAVVTSAQSTLGETFVPVIETPSPDTETPFPFFSSNEVPSSSANAAVRNAMVTADVHGGGNIHSHSLDFGGAALQGSLSVSGNLVQAEATGNRAGQRGAAGIEAGNALFVAGTPAVTGAGSGAMVRLDTEGSRTDSSVVADLVVLSSQLNRANSVGAEVQGGIVAAGVDGIGRTGTVSVGDNLLRAAATANMAGNVVDVQTGTFSATAAAANLQANQNSSVRASQQSVGVTAQVRGFDGSAVEGSISLSGNQVASAADGNVAVTSASVQGTALRGNGETFGNGSTAANTWNGAQAGTGAAVSATNAQTNGAFGGDVHRGIQAVQGDWGNDVTASVKGGFVRADLGAGASRLAGATVSLQDNAITARAGANTAATGVSLAGSDVASRAAVVNAQASQGTVGASVGEAGVQAAAGGIASGAVLAASGNRVASEASANQASNTLGASFDRLDATSGHFHPMGEGSSFAAAQAIASEQRSSDAVQADTHAAGITAIVGRSGAADSSIAVHDNQVAASARANEASDAITLEGGTIGREGFGGAVAAIGNAQAAEGMSRASLGRKDRELLIGTGIAGGAERANVAVTANTVVAATVGNTATNRLGVTAGSLQDGRGFELLTINAGEGGGTDFAIANLQQDQAFSRSAETRGVHLAIDLEKDQKARGFSTDGNRVGGSTLVLSDNAVTAEARSNDATNRLDLAGFGQLAGSAAVLNAQMGQTRVDAVVDGARLRIHADDTWVDASQLKLAGNRVQSIAVGASASNSLSARAEQLGGGTVWMPTFGVTGMPLEAGSAFSVQNIQAQHGGVAAVTDAAVRIRFAGSTLAQGAVSVEGNRLEALAQATSASNTLELAGTQVGAGGTVSSQQVTEASVAATLLSQGRNATVGIEAGDAYGTSLAVKDNRLLASAGQNEAFNSLAVNAVGATGSHAVLNSQSGSGAVSASAQPRFVGIGAGSVAGAPVTVSGNTVAAQASFNNAANSMALGATADGSATGMVRNEQATRYGAVAATVGGEEGLLIGVGQQVNARGVGEYGYGMVLNGASAAVSGNSVVSDAAANTAANTLNVVAPQAVRSGYGTGYSVLNSQTNAASVSATVSNTALGLSSGAMYGATGSVAGNQVQAQGIGNKASNVIGFGATMQPAQGQALIQNVQFNNASIQAAVRGVAVGAGGGYGSGSNLAVQGNSISAQAVGNSAVNMLTIK